MRVHPWLAIAGAALLVGCDHGTKHLARVHLEGRSPIQLVAGALDFVYTENHDSAFGLLRALLSHDARWRLLVVTNLLVTIGALAFLVTRWHRLTNLARAGMIMVIAGGIANWTDRIFRGYVIDFIHVHYWPVFNVADIAVCVGGALFVLAAKRPETDSPS